RDSALAGIQSQIEGVGPVGNGANRNDVHAGGRNLGHTVQMDTPGSFGGAPAVDELDPGPEVLHAEIVQQNACHASRYHGFYLLSPFSFHDDRGGVPDLGFDALDGFGQCAAVGHTQGSEMVVFEHDCSRQAKAVIDTATCCDRVFFKCP